MDHCTAGTRDRHAGTSARRHASRWAGRCRHARGRAHCTSTRFGTGSTVPGVQPKDTVQRIHGNGVVTTRNGRAAHDQRMPAPADERHPPCHGTVRTLDQGLPQKTAPALRVDPPNHLPAHTDHYHAERGVQPERPETTPVRPYLDHIDNESRLGARAVGSEPVRLDFCVSPPPTRDPPSRPGPDTMSNCSGRPNSPPSPTHRPTAPRVASAVLVETGETAALSAAGHGRGPGACPRAEPAPRRRDPPATARGRDRRPRRYRSPRPSHSVLGGRAQGNTPQRSTSPQQSRDAWREGREPATTTRLRQRSHHPCAAASPPGPICPRRPRHGGRRGRPA